MYFRRVLKIKSQDFYIQPIWAQTFLLVLCLMKVVFPPKAMGAAFKKIIL